MSRWPIITGGLAGPAKPRARLAYRLGVNVFGRTYVYFSWSPSDNVFDCIMPLAEAVACGLVAAPRATSLRLAEAVGR